MTLSQRLLEHIQREGPLSVADYMSLCLYDEAEGFYTTTEKLTDHFVTAPEMSQLFGEMLAIYLTLKWEQCGKPASMSVIELGPGQGTLARDLTCLLSQYVGKETNLAYILVEKSPSLREQQKKSLHQAPCPVTWADWDQALALSHASGCVMFVANEFFDAMPFHQYVKVKEVWCERKITCDPQGKLEFILSQELSFKPKNFPQVGQFYECSPQREQWFQHLMGALSFQRGAAVMIDYGYGAPEEGYRDTFQALYRHTPVDPLTHCGRADLTAHVDFGRLMSLKTHPTIATQLLYQRDFLLHHGLMLRLERLMEGKSIPQRSSLVQGAQRLVAPEQMGTLFKVLLAEKYA